MAAFKYRCLRFRLMSALGHKQTFSRCNRHVRFTPEHGHSSKDCWFSPRRIHASKATKVAASARATYARGQHCEMSKQRSLLAINFFVCDPPHTGLNCAGLRVSGVQHRRLCHAPQARIQSLLRSRRSRFSNRRARHNGVTYIGGNCH